MCIFSLQFYCTVHTLSLINVGFLPLLSSTGYPSNYPSALGLNLTHWLAVNSLIRSWPQPHPVASRQFIPLLLASTPHTSQQSIHSSAIGLNLTLGQKSTHPSAIGLNLTHWLAVNSLLHSWPQPHPLDSSQFTPQLFASTSPSGQWSTHPSALCLNFTKWHAVKLPICLNHPQWLAVNSPLSSLP